LTAAKPNEAPTTGEMREGVQSGSNVIKISTVSVVTSVVRNVAKLLRRS
jgi:hypothetical protein